MKIFITGAAGFIGSNFVKWLLEKSDHEITGYDNLSTGFEDNLPSNNSRFIFVKASICDANALENAFKYFKPDQCYHFAAYAAEGRSNRIRYFNHFNNTVGTAAVINACVNHHVKLIFTSSVAVYSGAPPFNEFTVPDPIDEYGLSKMSSEKSIMIASLIHGLEYCIIRPRNVYGPQQSLWDEARNVFGIWMNQVLNDKPMTIFGTGNQRRCFTFVGDILPAIYKAGNYKEEIINLGSPTPYSIMQANLVMQQITRHEWVEFLPARHEVQDAICETTIQENLLGPIPETSLIDGLSQMWRWAKSHPQRPMTKMPELEIKF